MCYIELSEIKGVQMEEQTENHYGNITFSQLAHFIVSLCGYDALLSEKELTESEKKLIESKINDAYKEKGTYEKFRFTDKNSIFSKVWGFFTKLEDDFEIPKIELISPFSLDGEKSIIKNCSHSQHFYYNLIWYYILNIGTSLETDQATLSKSILFSHLWNNETLFTHILPYKNISFKNIFEDFKNKHRKTHEKIYKLVENNCKDKDADSIKRTLEQCRKENKNPPWKVFYPLLKTFYEIDKEYSEKLFNCYFYTNFKNSLKHLAINEGYWNKLEEIIDNHEDESKMDFLVADTLKINRLVEEQSEILNLLNELTKENIPSSLEKFEENKSEIKKKLPNLFPFFENWFLAKKFVFQFLEKTDLEILEKAVEWYLKALEERKYFAGIFLIKFLTEAVSVSIYYDYKKNPAQARKRIQNHYCLSNGTKTALDKNSKVFFDFALAFDIFVNEKKDSAILYYHASENFWLKFPPTSEKSEKLCKDDYLKFMRIELDNEKDNFCKSKQFYENISDNKINHHIPSKKDISYTPILMAICQKYYDIVELYLDEKEYPSLDVNTPATNKCYPVHEILTKCWQSGTTILSPHAPVRDIDSKLKDLFFKILERTDKKVLSTETNRTKISILQTAIDTLDIEIVQAVLEKMLGEGKFPSDYRITADEMSPLYYAINKRNHLVNPDKNDVMSAQNIKYENLFGPGFTAETKERYFNNIMKFTSHVAGVINEKLNNIPKDEWEKSISKIDKIIDLLISKTENVDDFIFYPPAEKIVNNIGVNALLLTCEYNDTVTCKKLIEAGADLSKSIGKCLHPHPFSTDSYFFFPHNFIYRAIQFESWDCLELVLTEYKQKIKDTNMMHCSEGFPITPLVYFLILSIGKSVNVPYSNQQYSPRFIPLFLDAGADFNEPTIYGSANKILQG